MPRAQLPPPIIGHCGRWRTGQIRYAVTSKKASALGTAPPQPQMMETFPALRPVPNATVAAFEMAKQPAPALMFAVAGVAAPAGKIVATPKPLSNAPPTPEMAKLQTRPTASRG